MTGVGFYHLTRQGNSQEALPKLLGRVLEVARARPDPVRRCRTRPRLGCRAVGCQPIRPGCRMAWRGGEYDAAQPLLIADQDIPAANGARFLVLVDGAASARLADV
jgi:DNA polymerase-3 subunit chi